MFPSNPFNTINNLQHTSQPVKKNNFTTYSCVSAKAYVNHFLAIPNAMYSHSVYLYLIYIRKEGNRGKCTGGEMLGGDVETVET